MTPSTQKPVSGVGEQRHSSSRPSEIFGNSSVRSGRRSNGAHPSVEVHPVSVGFADETRTSVTVDASCCEAGWSIIQSNFVLVSAIDSCLAISFKITSKTMVTVELMNSTAAKIVLVTQRGDSINRISNKVGTSYSWVYDWIGRLDDANIISKTDSGIQVADYEMRRRYEEMMGTLYSRDEVSQDDAYVIPHFAGMEYAYTEIDAAYIWTDGGYQIARSHDDYPVLSRSTSVTSIGGSSSSNGSESIPPLVNDRMQTMSTEASTTSYSPD